MKISPPALTRREQLRVALVGAAQAEAHDREAARRAQLPLRVLRHPALEPRGQLDAAADVGLEARAPVAAEHRPQLQRSEAPAERGPVLAQAERVLGIRRAQVLGDQAERRSEVPRPAGPQQRAVHRGEHPLVSVDHERVGVLDPLERPAMLRADHRRTGVRGIDMEPGAGALRRRGDRRQRVDCGRRSRANRGHDGGGVGQVAQLIRAHPELLVDRHLAQPQAQHPRGLVDRRVGLLGAHDELAAGRLAGGDERRQARGRGRVLDVPVPAAGQTEQIGDPVEHDALELGRGRRGPPQDRDRVQRRRQQLGEDRRLGRAGGEVGEVAWVLPVGDPGQQQLVEVAQHVGERLRVLRRPRRQPGADLPRPDLSQHRPLGDRLQIARRPLQRRRPVSAQIGQVAAAGTGNSKSTPVSCSEISHSRAQACSS